MIAAILPIVTSVVVTIYLRLGGRVRLTIDVALWGMHMKNIRFPRGSEWRRWDLQVHTPFSSLNNGFGSDFDKYAAELFRKALDANIAAIGVTDYFTIEGYGALRKLTTEPGKLEALIGDEDAKRARDILLLPNVELRSSVIITRPGGDSRVNFHVIFDDSLETEVINECFLRELHFTAEGNPGGQDERWSLTSRNLEQLGSRLKQQHEKFQPYSDLYVGMMNAVISHEEVTDVLSRQASRFGERYLLVVPVDEDLSRVNWNGQGHQTRKLFIQKSHMIFSGNPSTREFGLGRKHQSSDEYIAEFRSFKPCVHGSDAHDYTKLFLADEGRSLWVKADPTFSGLRQLLVEPDDRVFIGTSPPVLQSIERRRTKVVDSVRVQRRESATTREVWFNDVNLSLNPELVAIIGNKGSGKSALADILGLLGNTPRSASFSFLKPGRFRDRDNKARQFEATLRWIDSTEDGPTGLDEEPATDAVEKIRYIPQNYLEDICNEVGSGRGGRFYAELQQVIFSHVSRADKLGFATLDELLEHRGVEISEAIQIRIEQLRSLNHEIVSCEDRASERHKKSIASQLSEKQRELQAHIAARPQPVSKPEEDPAARQESKAAAERLTGLRELLEQVDVALSKLRDEDGALTRKLTTAEKLRSRLKNLQRQVEISLSEATEEFEELTIDPTSVVNFSIDEGPILGVIASMGSDRDRIRQDLDQENEQSLAHKRFVETAEIRNLQEVIGLPERIYQEYLEKEKVWQVSREAIQGASDQPGSIVYLERQLQDLQDLPSLISRLHRDRRRISLEILQEKRRLGDYYRSYYGAVQQFLQEHPLAKSGTFKLTFDVVMVETGFAELFLSKINRRRSGTFAGVDSGATTLNELLADVRWDSALSVSRFLKVLIEKLQNGKDGRVEVREQLLQNQSEEALYDAIFSLGYIAPIYRLTWDGKSIEQLSPGERGNLLLIFYLLIDRDDIPLVIDQPEENLDNQTVVKTLVPCMKDAKRRRQIIMVTHNPNLAVVCDAEQIIYAEISKNQGNRVDYESGSIEEVEINRRIVDVLEGTRPAFDMRDAKYKV